jgi:hypothetical protein
MSSIWLTAANGGHGLVAPVGQRLRGPEDEVRIDPLNLGSGSDLDDRAGGAPFAHPSLQVGERGDDLGVIEA